MTDKTFELWRAMPEGEYGGIEVVRARMGPCGLKGHFHDRWSLGLIIQGACRFRSGGNMHQITQGGLFVIPPYEVHQCSAAVDHVVYQILYVTEAVMSRFLSNTMRFAGENTARVKNLPRHVFQRLLGIDGRSLSQDDLAARFACLDRLFAVLATPSAERPIYHRLQDILHHDWGQDLSLKAVAEKSGYSRWHAIRTFQQHTGLAPRAYLRQLRVLKARHLLQQGHALADIAQTLHFSDQAHFSRVFKSVYGVPPGRLQRLMRERKGLDEQGTDRDKQQYGHQAVEAMHPARCVK